MAAAPPRSMMAESSSAPGWRRRIGRLLPFIASGLGILAAIALAWSMGPLVSLGGVRPFESPSMRWALTAVILLVALGAAGWKLFRFERENRRLIRALGGTASSDIPATVAASPQAEAAVLRRRFESALAILKRERFGRERPGAGGQRWGGQTVYELPWYVFIGAPGSGKTTALVNSGLEFPLAQRLGSRAIAGLGGTRNCEWWFTSEAVLIDTAGRYTSQDSSPQTDAAAWAAFLQLLKRSRPRQPINGVLLTISVADLLQSNRAARARHSRQLQMRLQELETHLGIRFPVYVLVTKTDLLPGFTDFFGNLTRAQREQVWGVTFPSDEAAGFKGPPVNLNAELDRLESRLNECLIVRLQEEQSLDRRASLYEFPQHWRMFSHLLTRFLDDTVPLGSRPKGAVVRGVYFTSGTQEGMPLDRVLHGLGQEWGLPARALQTSPGLGRSYFVTGLLRDVVIAESPLAGTNLEWERRRARLWRVTGMATAAVCVIVAGLWAWRYGVSARGIEARSAEIDTLAPMAAKMRSAARSDPVAAVPLLDGVYALSRSDDADASGTERFAVRALGLDRSDVFAATAAGSYRDMLRQVFLPRLAAHLEDVIRARRPDEAELLYDALKAYLMLFGGRNFDADQLRSYLIAEWTATLPESSRASLVAHLDRLLASGEVGAPAAADAALIEQARAQLRRVPVPERIYARLKHNAGDRVAAELTLSGALGPAAEHVFAGEGGEPLARGIPSLYTRDGYEQWVRPRTGELVRQLAREEPWVMGVAATVGAGPASPGDGALDAGTETRWGEAVEQLYFADYARLWKAFLGDVRLARLASVPAMVEIARSFSRPDSPLTGLVALAAHQLSLPPFAHSAAGDEARFQSIRQLGGNLGSFNQEMGSLFGRAAVQLAALDAAMQGKSELPAGDALRALRTAAAGLPDPVRPVLESFAAQASTVSAAVVRDVLSRRIAAEVSLPCAALVAGRFPLARSSPEEMSREAFARAFGAGGLFDGFFQRHLAAHVDTGANPWRFRAVDGWPADKLPALASFQQASAIRQAFFRENGAALGMQIDLTLIDLDRSLSELLIDLDGQQAHLSSRSRGPFSLQWPGPEQPGHAQVQAVTPAGPLGPGFRFDGPWALFRMLDRVRVESSGAANAGRMLLQFDIEGRRAHVEWAARTQHPLRVIREGFQCPPRP